MAHIYGTRPLSWYAKQAPPDDEETEDEIKEHNREIARELDAWCIRAERYEDGSKEQVMDNGIYYDLPEREGET